MTKLNDLKNATEIRGLAVSMPSLLGKPVFFKGVVSYYPLFLLKKLEHALLLKTENNIQL